MAVNNPGDGSQVGEDSVRATVNGRKVVVRRLDGLIVKGPSQIKGQYLAANQLDHLAQVAEYHGHLCLAPTPADRRLAESEFELMEHKLSRGRLTLVEGMSITYNSTPGWKILSLSETAATLSNGSITRKVSRARLEQESSFDYTGTLESTEDEFNFSPTLNSEEHQGSIELDDAQLREAVSSIIDSKMDALVDLLATKVAERLGNTLPLIREGSTGNTE